MNRLNRLSAMLIVLQTRKVVQAQDLADRYGVSLRTVYRDMRSLMESGVPVLGEAGVGYSLADYGLPPVMLTREEATALLIGQSLVEGLTDAAIALRYRAAVEKIRSAFKTADKEYLADFSARLTGLSPQPGANHALEVVEQALAQSRVLGIDYRAGVTIQETSREVEPIGLVFYGQAWHLIAFCRLRLEMRDFRVDRIRRAALVAERFLPSARPSLKAYMAERTRSGGELTEVTVDFSQKVVGYVLTQARFYGLYDQRPARPGYQRMSFAVEYPEAVARWLLTYVGEVEIVAPAALQDRVAALAEEAARYFAQSATLLT